MSPSPSSFVIPPLDGSLSLAALIDFHLEHNPSHKYARLVPPSGSDVIPITYGELGRAVHRAAALLNPIVNGVPSFTGKIVAIFATTDTLLYQTLVLAVLRSGNIPFPISNRNSVEAVVHLVEQSACHHVLYGRVTHIWNEAREALNARSYDVSSLPLPEFEQVFTSLGHDDELAFLPYPDLPNSSPESLAFLLHSSGSTGLPKPVVLSNRYVIDNLNLPAITEIPTSIVYGTISLPPFHMLGFIVHICIPLSRGCIITLWAPADPPPTSTPENTLAAFQVAQVQACVVIPSFLVSWVQDEEAIKFLYTMRFVLFGGGPLPQQIGDKYVEAGVNITGGVGGTEFGTLAHIIPKREPKDWAWFKLSDRYLIRWNKVDGDEHGAAEMQILESPKFAPALYNSQTPEGPAYSTNDLWVEHPEKPGLWKIIGRLDDQITLATGEKINPGPIQAILGDHPLVKGAVLVGRARNQVALLVELIPSREFDPHDNAALTAFRNEIGSSIDAANRASASFARIFKELVIPTTRGKPLPRTPKGTISYKAAVALYTSEIDALYDQVARAKGQDVTPPESWSQDDIIAWLRKNLEDLLKRRVDPQIDLFDQGADSLTAMFIHKRIVGAMERTAIQITSPHIEQNILFTHPTIESLAQHLNYLTLHPQQPVKEKNDATAQAIHEIQSLIERYSASIPVNHCISSDHELSHETVLLTGSTGALGSLLLEGVLKDERVERIWAVNRGGKGGKTIEERQREAFEDKDLDEELISSNVESGRLRFVEAVLHETHLGLDETLYHGICATTSLIIHNAWRLDFNLSISSFEPHIKGTRNLIDVALASPRLNYTRILFTSSVATVQSWPDALAHVAEEPISDARISVGNGYGEGKYVAEKLLEAACNKANIPTTNFRVGQLSGSTNGMWSITDWVPIIVASSVALGYLPDAVGSVSWLPLHHAAHAILDVALDRSKPLEQTLHLLHPKPTPWSIIFTHISTALEPIIHKHLPLVPFSEWFAQLEQAPLSEMARIPGLKLLSLYKALAHDDANVSWEQGGKCALEFEAMGQARLRTDKMQHASETIAEVPTLGEEDATRWVAYWNKKGMFAS